MEQLFKKKEKPQILLSDMVKKYEDDLIRKYENKIMPSQREALKKWKKCRTLENNNYMLIKCDSCGNMNFVPHSCGHRNCPHCQNYETSKWIYKQMNKLLPVEYYLLTFNIPPELNRFTYNNQEKVYSLLMQEAGDLIKQVFRNEHGIPGAIAILHTHTRDLRYHPHVHFLVPNIIVDIEHGMANLKVDFLSNFDKYAPEFGAKLSLAMANANLEPPINKETRWKIDCRKVGFGKEAILYFGRNLYKGPLLEEDILSCKDGKVTFQYKNGQTGEKCIATKKGPEFLWLLLQHILPKNFRRARNFGFLSSNSKDADKVKKILEMFMSPTPQKETLPDPPKRPQFICSCCGQPMKIVATQISQYTSTPTWITDKMRM